MKWIKRWANAFLNYVVRDRRTPEKNRERVGQNLMLLAVFMFFIFIINFIVIIGTDSKFGVSLSKGAKNVYQAKATVQAKRGTIYDRDGNPIAEDSTTYSVYAILSKTYKSVDGKKLYVQKSQFDKVAQIFKKQLGMKKQYVLDQLNQKDVFQVSFGTKGGGLSYSTMSSIKEAMKKAKIEGIAFTTSPGRLYKNGAFASQFIGFTQLKEDKNGDKVLIGTSGMEASLDDILSGTDGEVTYEKDKNGNILLGTETTVKPTVNGKDVYTTLSEPLQTYLETQMDVFQEEAKGKYASATVVNAKTGEILATSQRPTYNPNTLEGYNKDNLHSWNNPLYQTTYEPGSTMKVMTLASSIDDGVFNPNEGVVTTNGITVADTTINDWNVNEGQTGGYMTLAQGFAFSSNVAMTTLEQKMGADKWLNYLSSKFRFGYPTRFGLGGEAAGILTGDNKVTTAMTSFGQGINVTQVQMLRAFSAISNDGKMLEPQFISKLVDTNQGNSRVSSAEVVGNPISEEAASQTRDYMVTVGTDPQFGTLYSKALGGPVIQVGNYSVAVKSGTAQIAAEDGSGYLEGGQTNYIFSVVAMVPSDNPSFLMYVTLQEPEHQPLLFWKDVVNPVLEYAMQIEDNLTAPVAKEGEGESSYKLPNVIGKSPGEVAVTLRQNLVHPIVLGTGSKITKVSKKAGSNIPANKQVLIMTSKLKEIPDMYGWDKKLVKLFSKWTGIKINFKGSETGKVIKQNVDVGKNIKKVKKITITLGD